MFQEEEIKKFNVRLPYHLWHHLKTYCLEHNQAMNTKIIEFIAAHKKKQDKSLEND